MAITISDVSTDIKKTANIYESLRQSRPNTKKDLQNYVKVFLGINIPDSRICPEHATPMEYLWHAWNTDFAIGDSAKPNGDAIVWANRGGGKTEIAAIATLLDCLFKPNCQVRILGGSLDQSNRMYEYLTQFVYKGFESFLAGPLRSQKCTFKNASSVEVLTQSAKSVRGRHVHKLRCDEIELFDEQVFAAAKFITQSTDRITAAMETISTMHRPYGLMHQLVNQAGKNNTPIFKWCVWEVIEKCTDRTCSQCPLWPDCNGKAKKAIGYLKIDDCITQMRRSSRAGFETEMLCKRPSLENVVLADFDPAIHVSSANYDPNLPLYRTIDFGFVNPFVCLWIQVDSEGTVRVIDEYFRSRATMQSHAEQLKSRTPCPEEAVAATFCDPAGAGRNDVTGTSSVRELASMGVRTRYKSSGILQGIELIRRALKAGDGTSRLIIDPKCVRLIEAMQCYHYPDTAAALNAELPLKDGIYDHPIDALRYFFINLTKNKKPTSRRY